MKHKVLLVLTDEKLGQTIESALERAGYEVFSAPDRYRAIALMNRREPELIVLDRSVPDSEVIMICRSIRWEMKLPASAILVISEKENFTDRFLDIRVDDHLVHPFEMEDLLEKLSSMQHRLRARKSQPTLKAGNIEMLPEQWMVYVEGGPVNLTEKEYRLLQELMEANGRVLTRETLLERVWGHQQAANIESRTLDVHMSRLRNKLGISARNIITVRNVGYRMAVYPE